MECDICALSSSERTKFHCQACARAILYPRRIEQARILLDREKLGKQIEAVVTGKPESVPLIKLDDDLNKFRLASRKLQHDGNARDIESAKDRIEEIIRASDNLKEKIDSYKKEVADRKEAQAQRRKDKELGTSHLRLTHKKQLGRLKDQVRKQKQIHEAVYSDLLDGRIWLCHEAAVIHALRKAPDPLTNIGRNAQAYTINGLPIPDLRDLTGLPPEEISTALTQVCRLLAINSAYLGVRIPAEITLPGRNWPLPTILPPGSSYQDARASFPTPSNHNIVSLSGAPKSTQPSSRNASTKTVLNPPVPRPRPLFLSQALPHLAREDPTNYALFIEGVSLLAWNIAWLCRTQGLDIASGTAPNSWEEVCDIGRNMFLLFVEAPRAARKQWREHEKARALGVRLEREREKSGRAAGEGEETAAPVDKHIRDAQHQPLFGHRSHTTSFAFLPSATSIPISGIDVAASARSDRSTSSSAGAGWAFANPQKIRDALRAHLNAVMQDAGWEYIEPGDVRAMEESAVVLVGKGKPRQAETAARTGISRGERMRSSIGRTERDCASNELRGAGGDGQEGSGHRMIGMAIGDGGGEGSTPPQATGVELDIEQEKDRKVNGWTKLKSRAPL